MEVIKKFDLGKDNTFIEVPQYEEMYDLKVGVKCQFNQRIIEGYHPICLKLCHKCDMCDFVIHTGKFSNIPYDRKKQSLFFINNMIEVMLKDLVIEHEFDHITRKLMREFITLPKKWKSENPIFGYDHRYYKFKNKYEEYRDDLDNLTHELRESYFEYRRDINNEDNKKAYEDKKKEMEDIVEEACKLMGGE